MRQLFTCNAARCVQCSNADLARVSGLRNFTIYTNKTDAGLMDKFKKIDKDFLLTDSSLNSYSYRLLTSGYLMDEFKKNPIGYYLHADPDNTEYTRKDGVLVKWEDIRKDGDNVYGKPCINLSHPRGQKTVDEIESGFLNAASMGHFVVIGSKRQARRLFAKSKKCNCK
jgi:hypothetical protein